MFAGAAFTDQADIKVDSDVVDTLVSLGVINGYTDGSFKPNDTVTRAEMAKMIYVLRTGNSDASAYNDDYSTFADIKGHWARGYVKYCQSLGIIAGQSATKFAPDQTVTAQEAAKMLLVTLGYDAQKAGLVGTTWAAKTNALADENGLLEDVNTSFTGPCPRQYAAQLIYNAIDAPTVVWRDDAYTTNNYGNGDNPTIGEKYMGLKKTVGTLYSVNKQDNKDTYDLTITNVNTDDSSDKCLTSFTKVAKDYSALKYNTVKVLYKAKDNVYGVFATDDNTVQSGLLSDLKYESATKVKLDGTKYDLAKTTSVYVDGEDTSYTIASFAQKYSDNGSDKYATYKEGTSVELIAADGSSNYSILKVKTYKVSKVTYVGSDYVNTKAGKFDDDDYVIADGLKKDDYVVITAAGNYADKDGRIEKAEVVEGKVVGTKGDDKVQIGDKWYKMATGVTQPAMSANVKLILVNGYAYDKDTISAGSEDVALVVKLGESSTVGSKYYQARMIFSDGTDKTVDVEKKDGNDKALGKFSDYDNTLVTYDISKNVYTITAVKDDASAKTAGYDAYKCNADTVTIDASVRYTDGRVYFEDDAVAFVAYKNGDYKVVTGKAVAGWKATAAKTVKTLITMDDNTKKASVAFIDLDAKNVPGGSDTTYAVALDKTYTNKVDGTTYYFTKAWNGTEEVLYKSEDTTIFKKGQVFEYSADGADTVSVDRVTMTNTQVASYSNGDISFKDDITYTDQGNGTAKLTAGQIREIDSKDTVVLYVDSDKAKGVGDGEIRVGNAYNNAGKDTDKANVSVNIAYGDGAASDGYVTVIVVDVNNNIEQW